MQLNVIKNKTINCKNPMLSIETDRLVALHHLCIHLLYIYNIDEIPTQRPFSFIFSSSTMFINSFFVNQKFIIAQIKRKRQIFFFFLSQNMFYNSMNEPLLI